MLNDAAFKPRSRSLPEDLNYGQATGMRERCPWLFDANGEGSHARMGGEQVNHALTHVLHETDGFGRFQHDFVDGDLDVSIIEGLVQVLDAIVPRQRRPHRENERLRVLTFLLVPAVSGHDFVGLETNTPLHGTTSVLLVALVDPNQVVAKLRLDRG